MACVIFLVSVIIFLLLVENTKGVEFNGFFFFDHYFSTIETFPAVKV